MECDYYRPDNYWLISNGCDWLTGTTTYPDSVAWLEDRTSRIAASEMKRGCAESLWYFEGFRGWNCGSISFGYSNDRAIIRLSSHLAKEHWLDCVPHLENISRFDLQSTYRFKEVPPTYAEDIEDQLLAHKLVSDSRRIVELKRNSNKGNTVYVGTRQSQRFMRAYHKGLESKDKFYANCLRFEVQYNKRLANGVARHIAGEPAPGARMLEMIPTEFSRVGLKIDLKGPRGEVERVIAPKSTREKQLAWLCKQVRPLVEKMVANGDREAVMTALGL